MNSQMNMIASRQSGLAPWQMDRIFRITAENLGERLTVAQLALSAGLSQSQLSRAFKRSCGISPHRYVIQRRLERAQELMLTTSESLGMIAVICGMTDQSHLTRWFKRIVGATPHRWRRDNRLGLNSLA